MDPSHDLDAIFRDWPFKPGVISARLEQASDGRQVLQMRIDMGILQMEMVDRPDGEKPGGERTYLEWLEKQAAEHDKDFKLASEQCMELDREFLQFYHRRICCLALRQFARAMADAEHTLRLMDFLAKYSQNPEWTQSHEQYRPFVLFHRVQAAAMVELQRSGPEGAIELLNQGLDDMKSLFISLDIEGQFDNDELVGQLVELKESLRQEYHVGRTLAEQLSDAVASEQYEHAARLRDEIARRRGGIF
jgi:hypothetical protein